MWFMLTLPLPCNNIVCIVIDVVMKKEGINRLKRWEKVQWPSSCLLCFSHLTTNKTGSNNGVSSHFGPDLGHVYDISMIYDSIFGQDFSWALKESSRSYHLKFVKKKEKSRAHTVIWLQRQCPQGNSPAVCRIRHRPYRWHNLFQGNLARMSNNFISGRRLNILFPRVLWHAQSWDGQGSSG